MFCVLVIEKKECRTVPPWVWSQVFTAAYITWGVYKVVSNLL